MLRFDLVVAVGGDKNDARVADVAGEELVPIKKSRSERCAGELDVEDGVRLHMILTLDN